MRGGFADDLDSANESETEHQIGFEFASRLSPATKALAHVSRRLRSCGRMRIASSRRILDRGGPQDLIAEVAA